MSSVHELRSQLAIATASIAERQLKRNAINTEISKLLGKIANDLAELEKSNDLQTVIDSGSEIGQIINHTSWFCKKIDAINEVDTAYFKDACLNFEVVALHAGLGDHLVLASG